MDILHVLSCNPLEPAYAEDGYADALYGFSATPRNAEASRGWLFHGGGLVEVGHDGPTFAFDNELPRHAVQLRPFAIVDSLVTSADWFAFIDDRGYHRPDLWLSDGWAAVQTEGWEAPLYWSPGSGG